MSLAAAATREARIDRLFARWTGPGRPGAAVAVAERGAVALRRFYGQASLEHAIPIDGDTAFRIGSISKHFSALLALTLADEGRLRLEDEIHRYVPELPRYEGPVTLAHLLSNTSGVHDFLELLTASGAGVFRPVPWAESFRLVMRQRTLNCRPGEEFVYSAGGFLLLGLALERITGEPIERLLETRLLAPAGLTRTRLVRSDRTVVPGMATPYLEPATGTFERGGWGIEASGEGGIVSTLDEMVRWVTHLTRHPSCRGPFSRLATPWRYASGGTGRYGLGLYATRYRGQPCVGHGGRAPGFRAELMHFPAQDVSIIVLANVHSLDPFRAARRVADHWLASELAPQPEPVPAFRLARLAGVFGDPASGDVLEVRVEAGRPVLAASSGPLDLEQVGPEVWEPESALWDLSLSPGRTGGLEIVASGRRRILARLPAPDASPEPGLAGTYRNDDLPADYHVSVDEAGLRLRMQGELGHHDTVLTPLAPDVFRAAPADPKVTWNQPTIRFRRAADGAPSALTYLTDRTRHLGFRRV